MSYFFIRIQYGLGHFRLGDFQTYDLLYEPHNFCLKVVVVQLDKSPPVEKIGEAFSTFLQLMSHLEQSIFSVMDLYIPSAKHPVFHVGCPFCDNPNPHIMVECAGKISLNMPSLLCTKGIQHKILPKTSYIPFGDILKQQHVGKCGHQYYCQFVVIAFLFYVVGFKEFKVFTSFFDKLANILPTQNIITQLISVNIITIGDSEEIESIARTKEKAIFVLRKVAHSLDAGITESFYKLLTIMGDHKGDARILATEIQQELKKHEGIDSFFFMCSY